jgi:hypothetical protein
MQQRPNSKKKSSATPATKAASHPTRIGDVFAIKLTDSTYGYGQRLDHYMIRCFDLNTRSPSTDIDAIVSRNTIFATTVFRFAFSTWTKIGTSPVPEPFPLDLRRFRQDKSNPLICTIIETDGSEREATLTECIEANLEPGGVWDAPHIQERLLAHFHGTKSTTLEEAKLVVPPSHR